MNSYPVELLVQHAPLMFVAGLDVPPPPPPAIPVNGDASTPTSATHDGGQTIVQESRDPFVVLQSRLRATFAARRRGAIWDMNKSKHFNVILVDKNIKFPPRKVVPATSPNEGGPSSSQTPRSPLSPLNSASPLHPDGIIAPIWVRKHIELVPSVFVLFMRLAELPPPASPLEPRSNVDKDEERRRDSELAAEIALRKKSTAERNIKLTVVLIASRRMLDDPNLDTRLSFIRRQSGLDARAALFVLSPLSSAELNEFIESLQKALLEPAIEYYASHTKRVRRKKSRFPSQVTPLPPGSGPSTGRPLRPEGWIVRYEYKMATFAEFRMEDELARKHYEDCWEALCEMFSSPAILPPRTKRWAEARVLADSVSFKICKLYLYQSEFSRTVSHFNRHLRRLAEFSRSWGLGEDNFEFWSWVARQYRLFAELLESAARAGLEIPLSTGTLPPPSLTGRPAVSPNHGANPSLASLGDGTPYGFNPAGSVQHAGYYYFAAATCTQQRHRKYLAVTTGNGAPPIPSPALANEGKIDHQSIILELFIKAYETFKAQPTVNDRMTFHMAYRIAETYYQSGKYDLGAKFFERIARTYRREQWGVMLSPIMSMWCECAKRIGNVDATAKLLLEMMGLQTATEEERIGYEEELVEVLKSTSPSQPLSLEPSNVSLLVKPSVIFWQSDVFVGEPASFQLSLAALPGALQSLVFSSIHLYWDEHEPPIIIRHSEEADSSPTINLGEVTTSAVLEANEEADAHVKADLAWDAERPKVFAGTITPATPMDLNLHKLVLFLDEKDWHIEIPIPLSYETLSTSPAMWTASKPQTDEVRYIPIPRQDPSMCSATYRPHRINIAFDHAEPAYLEERYPINLKVTNTDDEDLEFDVDVLLQPTEDESVNEMTMEAESSSSLIKGVQFGRVKPGETVVKTLYLFTSGSKGDRVLDFSIQSRTITTSVPETTSPTIDDDDEEEHSNQNRNVNETFQTLTVSAIPSFGVTSEVSYQRDSSSLPARLDLAGYEPEVFHSDTVATVLANVSCSGPWDVVIESIKLVPARSENLRLTSSSLAAMQDELPLAWEPEDSLAVACQVAILDEDDPSTDHLPFPGHVEITWRRALSDPQLSPSTTIIKLPSLLPPLDGLIALIELPSSGRLHSPFTLRLSIQNRDPYRTADVSLDVDSSEAFVLAGPRHARVPALLPRSSEDVIYTMVPLLSGVVALPTFRLVDRRKVARVAESDSTPSMADGATAPPEDVGRAIRVVVIGQDARMQGEEENESPKDARKSHTILVHPY